MQLANRNPHDPKIPSSDRLSMIEAEHSTESIPAPYQPEILQPLMITLFVIVRHVVRQRAFER